MNSSILLFQAIMHRLDLFENELADMLRKNDIPVDYTKETCDALTKLKLSISSHDYGSYIVYELLDDKEKIIDSVRIKRFSK